REAFWEVMIADVRSACDRFLDLYRASGGRKGFVSIECDPRHAFDTDATVAEARQLAARVDRPNVMLKVPGTGPGLPAITRLVADGVHVNVTLLFAVERYEAVL